MTCRTFNEFLIDYRSDGLAPDEQARFEAHLIRCSHCVASLRSYEETIRLAESAFSHPDEVMTEDIPHELMQTILTARPRVRC